MGSAEWKDEAETGNSLPGPGGLQCGGQISCERRHFSHFRWRSCSWGQAVHHGDLYMKAPEKVGDGGVAVGDKLCIMGICIMKAPEKVGDEGVAVGDKLCLPPKCHSHGYKK